MNGSSRNGRVKRAHRIRCYGTFARRPGTAGRWTTYWFAAVFCVLLWPGLPAVGDAADDVPTMEGVLPIEHALAQARADFDGRVLEVELDKEERGSRGYVYEVKLLTVDGRVLKVEYDAHTLERVRVKGPRGRRRAGPED